MVTTAQDGGSGAAGLRYPVLDALRGLAALGVVFHHIPVQPDLAIASWDEYFGRLVDLFFVISGFVIASAYGQKLAGGYSIGRFLFLRWGRVWPLHAAMLLLFLVAFVTLGLARPDLRGTGLLAGRHDIADLPLALLLLNGFVPAVGLPWNHPSWSISIEMALYVLSALAWRGLGMRAAWAGAVAATAALAALSLAPDALGRLYDFARGIAGFGLGMALQAWLPRRSGNGLGRYTATVIEIAALAGIAVVLTGSGSVLAFDLLAVLLVGIAAMGQGVVSRALLARPFQTLGELSYALYMVHVFVIGRMFDVVGIVQGRLGWTIADSRLAAADALVGPGWQALLAKLVFIAICLVAAWAVAALIERPARAWSRRAAAIMANPATAAN